MASRFTYGLVISFFLLSLMITSCLDRAFCKDFIKSDVRELVKISNPSLESFVNIANNTISVLNRTFIFPGITSSDISVQNLEANAETFSHHTGYHQIKHSYDARMFYFFFKSRGSKNDPIVLWLNGGPGEGCLVELFYGNGPFRINDDLSLKWNDFGWDKACNLLYVDQPIGTGFSYSSDNRDIRQNTNEVVNDLYDFLQAFFQVQTEYRKNDFYIAGSSYSGHTIPVLASRLQKKNRAEGGIHINLKGFAIGNGLTNPEYQFSSYHDFALANKLIPKSSYNKLKKLNTECLESIQQCQTDENSCGDSHHNCESRYYHMLWLMDIKDKYNIKNQQYNSQQYNYSKISEFLALNSVRTTLNVGSREYVTKSKEVVNAMYADYMKNYAMVIPPLLEDGIKVLIYDGVYDLTYNWLGNMRWLNDMKWSGRDQFFKIKLISYKVDGNKVGQVKSMGPLTYLKVHNAGHYVSRDQPNTALQMLKSWMNA